MTAIPSPAGAAIVTGATGGIGYEVAEGLARMGRRVVLTGRNAAKGEAALARVLAAVPGARAEWALLDVGSLAAVSAFTASWRGPVSVLVNNAGVMAYPTRQVTPDGFEAQLGINYLGHFALTLGLLPALVASGGARVVSVSSVAHRRGRIAFDDLHSERRYAPARAYAQSKLAMLMFARELARRAAAAGLPVASVAAHPGWSATNIVANGMGAGLQAWAAQVAFNLFAQSAAAGAAPVLYAALDAGAATGGYYGPARWAETRGGVAPSRVMPRAADPAACARLWAASEAATRLTFKAA